jgi:hypothetical protein
VLESHRTLLCLAGSRDSFNGLGARTKRIAQKNRKADKVIHHACLESAHLPGTGTRTFWDLSRVPQGSESIQLGQADGTLADLVTAKLCRNSI